MLHTRKKLAVIGLGLIGSSFARAYANDEHWMVAGSDLDPATVDAALRQGIIDEIFDIQNTSQYDLIIIALYPQATIDVLRELSFHANENTLVIDCTGTKRSVTSICNEIADKAGFTFIGTHPMAGTHHSGFTWGTAAMFVGAPLVLTPGAGVSNEALTRLTNYMGPAGFGSISVVTPEYHDQMIAYTSQLAHVVSSAYIKSPTSRKHKGFSAGSFRDLTRVAYLNEDMWSELFLDNSDNLVTEIDTIIDNLKDYREAIATGDRAVLTRLLAEGRIAKEESDNV